MSISINTKDFVKGVDVTLDEDKKWKFHQPGAGVMLDISKNFRKAKALQGKKDLTDEEQEQMAELNEKFFNLYASMFSDGTETNSQVTEWLYNTPLETVVAVVEEIQKQTA